MADNISVTPGSGATVGTEDVGGVHYQKIKPGFGGDGVFTMVQAGSGLPVEVEEAPDNRESWRVDTQAEATANDSDKTLTVPTDTEWQVFGIHVTYVATSTAGNRQLAITWTDSSDNVIGEVRAGATQAESTTVYYMVAPGLATTTEALDSDFFTVSLPPVKLKAGQKLRVYDNNAVAAAADDMTVRVQIASRSTA